MKIGILSDVHANAPALCTVLDSMPDVDKIIHAGDVVGYGPHPSEVVSIFKENNIISIAGNHDRGIKNMQQFKEQYVPLAAEALKWTRNQLSESELTYLKSLPEECSLRKSQVHIAHGAPGKPDEYIYPGEITNSLLGEEDLLVLGHTHKQVACRFDNGLVLNPGSVGQPRDDDSTAAYAIADLDTLSIQLRRTNYPKEDTIQDIKNSGIPDALTEKL